MTFNIYFFISGELSCNQGLRIGENVTKTFPILSKFKTHKKQVDEQEPFGEPLRRNEKMDFRTTLNFSNGFIITRSVNKGLLTSRNISPNHSNRH